MARFVMLLALCVVISAGVFVVTDARPVKFPFIVHGRVYCDTCRCGFETAATSYIQGAKVRVVCKDRGTLRQVYSCEGVTDSTGRYRITVAEDHGDQVCEAELVSSPQNNCATAMPGREKARVILTNNNGLVSNDRFTNNLGFIRDKELAGCTQILKLYEEENL